MLSFSLVYAQNNSLDFDGNDDYVTMGDILDLGTSDFTIEAWIFVEGTATFNKIINKGLTTEGTPETAGYALRTSFDSPTNVDFTVAHSDGTFRRIQSTGITLNSWQHVAGVRDGSNIYLYINGTEVAAGTTPIIYNVNTNIPFAIGALHRGSFGRTSEVMDGKIDEVRIWNIARTQSDIQSGINTELIGTESGLIAYYKFDEEDSSCDIEDCNSNENNGIRNGMEGDNNLPQFSTNVPILADVACGAAIACTSLPVELNMFSGEKNGKTIDIYWQTNFEVDNSGFELQRSVNGRDWRTIHFLEASSIPNAVNDYRYQDNTPYLGLNHYRLQQIDLDGSSVFSEVIIIEFNAAENKVNVSPNPSGGLVQIQLINPSKQAIKVSVYDNLGRSIWESKLIENEPIWEKEININKTGVYFIKTQIGNFNYSKQVVVEKR